jgi:hypothetical protein
MLRSSLIAILLLHLLTASSASPLESPILRPDYFEEVLQRGKMDHTTMVDASVMVYYTTAFKNEVDKNFKINIEKVVQRLILVANTAYSQSGIPLRIHSYCIEQQHNVSETHTAEHRLYAFASGKDPLQECVTNVTICDDAFGTKCGTWVVPVKCPIDTASADALLNTADMGILLMSTSESIFNSESTSA